MVDKLKDNFADSDAGLVRRAKAGDAQAFGDLVTLHERSVYGIVSRMVRDRDEADDLVQEIFISAFRAIGGFRETAKFSTWLHSIAVNTTLKRLKRMKRERGVSIDDEETGLADRLESEDVMSPQEAVELSERSESVKRAVDSLPDKQKIVVVMHYFEEMPCEEIAQILGCSVGTVWSRLHYACIRLKGELRNVNSVV